MKSLELRLYEAASLIKALQSQLARERGGGSPATHREYIALRTDCYTWLKNNEPKESGS